MSGELWQGYTREIEQDQVEARFAKRFGYEPVEVRDAGTIWLAGPIGEPRADAPADDAQAGEQLQLWQGV